MVDFWMAILFGGNLICLISEAIIHDFSFSVESESVKKSLDDFVKRLVYELLEPEKNGLIPRDE